MHKENACNLNHWNRRQWLSAVAAGAAGSLLTTPARANAPTAPVAVAKCATYQSSELVPTLEKMFDQLGGLGKLVKGKTVTVKLNLTGDPTRRLGHEPAELAHWTHPAVIGATVHLMGKAGASRIRLVESAWSSADPLEETIYEANWDLSHMTSAAARVEFENTNFLGSGKKYHRLMVPGGGYMFDGFDLNHTYAECDVFVTIAKLKQHATTGVTMAMKNSFGNTPCTIYGDKAGVDEPSLIPKGGRGILHSGGRLPCKSAPAPKHWENKDQGWRVPRIVTDLVAARPIHLSIVDGIETMHTGEGPWIRGSGRISPHVMIAGMNPVTTDAVCTALMGLDPMADRGRFPFERCDNMLRLAEDKGIGTRDLKRIEVIGVPIAQAKMDFRKR